jgi:Chemoreceptor zinc-binding domain
MGIESDIEDAIHVHGAWKAHFRNFLSGKAELDLSTISQPHACKLGKWLEGNAYRMLAPEDYEEVCRLHAEFHRVAGRIVDNIKQKDFQSARTAIASGGAFDQASHELAAFLRKVALHSRPTNKAGKATPPEDAAATQSQHSAE